ncbi:partial DNA-invertase hin, partial [uncultured bacterium]
MAIIGYARVSTADQELEAQMEQLCSISCEKIFREKISGATVERPQLTALLEYVREGDILVVCKLDRIARSTKNLLDIVELLEK